MTVSEACGRRRTMEGRDHVSRRFATALEPRSGGRLRTPPPVGCAGEVAPTQQPGVFPGAASYYWVRFTAASKAFVSASDMTMKGIFSPVADLYAFSTADFSAGLANG